MSTSNTPNSDHKKQFQGSLAEGRRVKVFWEDDNTWYEGVVKRYSSTKDQYMVHYDDGGKEWEQMQFLDFIVAGASNKGRGGHPRRSARNSASSSSSRKVKRSARSTGSDDGSADDADEDGVDDEDEDADESGEDEASDDDVVVVSSRPSSRSSSRGVAAKKGSNGNKTSESDDSSESKPRKSNRAAKRKIESEDEEMEEEWDSDHEIKLKKPKAQPKKAKKKGDSESDYEEVPTSTRRSSRGKKVEFDDEEEEEVIELDDLSDGDDDEEEDEEDDDSGSDEEEEEEEEPSSEEEFKETRKRGRGKQEPKGKQKKPAKKVKAPRQPRGRPPAREVPTEGVQCIFAARRLNEPSTTTTTTTSTSTTKSSNNNSATVVQEAETTTTTSNVEMLVKYRGKSYREVEWITGDKLLEAYPSSKIRVRRVLTSDPLPDEIPNPDYSIIDRIVDKQVQKGKGKGVRYLVKWKSLPYEECTWEHEDDLQSDADLEKVNGYNEMESIALKRSNKARKPVKYVKNMDPPPFLGGRQLKDFQKEGFLWLTYCWHQKRSSLLADEMGLGKTIQTISLLEYLRTAQGIPGPFLVIAPLSTVENWQREITDWTGMRALVLHGQKNSRDIIRKHEWTWPNGTYKFDTLVTSYEIAIAESSLLSSTQWKVLVVDEAHRIKNQTSKLLSKLNTIKRDHCVMLTGTPLQNDMKELWSLLNFLDPDSFGSQEEFMVSYGDLKDSEQVQKLHEQLGPYILRRHKESVDATIPVKEETVLEVELSTVQKTYYRAIMDKNREFLGRGLSTKNNLPKLNNIMMQIRKVCNHPFLIPGVEDRLATEKKLEPGCIELLVNSCSKLMLVDKLLTKLREGGHKVLMFSQMVELLDILEEYLSLKDYPYERLDGGVKRDERQAGIDRFNDRSQDSFVYLLSTRAGGVGINLTAADTVIIYDSDWNPQNDLQAQARCHRIGQTENVKVYRLLSRNTYEQYMFQVSSRKLALGQVVLLGKNGEYDGESEELDKGNVDKLLKYGAYELFKEDVNEAATKEKHMQEEDIDSILQRATTITYDNTEPKDALGNGFNKATILMGDDNNEVGIDDADFWQKILPEYKDLEYFRERLASGVAIASEESKALFMEELTVYTNDRKEKPPQGKELLPADLLNLYLKIENSTKFNQEQRAKAKHLRETLETPRRRTAAQVSRDKTKKHAKAVGAEEDKDEDGDQYVDENEGDSSGSEDDEERPNKKRKTAAVGPSGAPAPSWNKARRERLKWALLRFGFGRWDKTAQVSRVSPEEAQVYTENCVCKLLKSPVAPTAVASHLITLNDQYELYMVNTANVARRSLPAGPTHDYDPMNKIDVTLENTPQDPAYVFTPGDRLQFKLVVSAGTLNWDESPDLRLIGMFGNELVRCYPIKNGVVSILAPGFIGTYEWKCVRPSSKNLIECGSPVTTQVGCHPMFFEENFDAAPRAPWVKKLSVLHILNEIGEETGPSFATLALPSVPAPPLPQWGKEQDRKLLMGVYKHGYGKFQEILADDEIALGSQIDSWVEATPELKHPTIPMLNKRLYKVLEMAKKHRESAKLDFERRERRRARAAQEGGEAGLPPHPGAPVEGGGMRDDVMAEEKDKDFILLTARIRFLNKELVIRMRDDDVFWSLRKPVLKQLNQLGYCREEDGKLVFAYKGFQITQPQTTTPRKLNIIDNFNLSLTWVLDSFKVEVVWLDKTVSLVHVRRNMRMTDILSVKYAEPYHNLRLVHNSLTLPLDYTIEEANLGDNSTLTVVRYLEKLRITVAGPDRPNQHFKVSRVEPFSVFMDHYAKVINTTLDQLSFTLNGRRLNPIRTPDELGVTERDIISITVETVLLIVKNEADNSTEKYTIHTKTNLKHLMSKYAARQAEKGNHNKVTFSYNGREIVDGCTASSMGIPNNATIVASWERDQTVVVSLHDYKTGTQEEYRVGVDVVLRDLVDAFCNDNNLSCSTSIPPRVTTHGKPVNLHETMKELGIQDRDVVHVVRDPPTLPSLKPALPPPRSDAPVYTIDD